MRWSRPSLPRLHPSFPVILVPGPLQLHHLAATGLPWRFVFDQIEARLDRERDGRHYSHFLLEHLSAKEDVDITQTFFHPSPPEDDDDKED
ncbi:unnamed protein product [Linum trigynum]|uniref:Uncharacterized protein n=1 Tax=Linum trigynum TaxID=586398 RepID=A0AAV2ESW3_9ROSI